MSAFSILVFASSSSDVAAEFCENARKLGQAIAERGATLVFGGSNCGTMKALAEGADAAGGTIHGVIPKSILKKVGAYPGCDSLTESADLRERKAFMLSQADAVICLPGGFGSLDELMESLALKQLGEHHKPIVLLNTSGFFTPFDEWIKSLVKAGFIRGKHASLYALAESVEAAVEAVFDLKNKE